MCAHPEPKRVTAYRSSELYQRPSGAASLKSELGLGRSFSWDLTREVCVEGEAGEVHASDV